MNVIKMNLYRMFKMKSFYITQGIFLVCIVFMIITTNRVNAGTETFSAVELSSCLYSGSSLYFLTIFVSLFANSERASGYLKNLSSCTDSRVLMYLSKIAVIAVYALIELLIPVVGFVIAFKWGNTYVGDFVIYILIEWLLHVVFGMFILLVMELFRHLLAGVLVGIFTVMGLTLTIISQLFVNVLKLNVAMDVINLFSIKQIQIFGACGVEKVFENCIPAIISIVVFGIIYTVAGSFSFAKRDMY